jgi:hypothetical protein
MELLIREKNVLFILINQGLLWQTVMLEEMLVQLIQGLQQELVNILILQLLKVILALVMENILILKTL